MSLLAIRSPVSVTWIPISWRMETVSFMPRWEVVIVPSHRWRAGIVLATAPPALLISAVYSFSVTVGQFVQRFVDGRLLRSD
jgi:hypothetical protein